jgi:hypothetical protein
MKPTNVIIIIIINNNNNKSSSNGIVISHKYFSAESLLARSKSV